MPTKLTLLLYFAALALFTSYCVLNAGMANRKAQFKECVLQSNGSDNAICHCASITELYELCPDNVTSVVFPQEIQQVTEGDTLLYSMSGKTVVFEYYHGRALKPNERLVTFKL